MDLKKSFFITVAFLIFGTANIQAQKINSSAELFKDGEKVCFIGNSITHSGSYHSLVYLFYQTRFPGRRIDAFNCGISGDNAERALKRFNKDIAVHKPTVATIKLGTNDINRSLYLNSTSAKEAEKRKADALYKSNMKELVRKLDSMQTKIIFLTPAYYEEKPMPDSTIALGLNKALGNYGLFVDSLKVKYKAGIVDFHFMLDSISMAQQMLDPEFTLNRTDRVHPEYDGHFIMAYTFLKALKVSPYISKTEITAKGKKVLTQFNCEIENLKISKRQIIFKSLEYSLPFPLSAYPKDTSLVLFTRNFNQEILQIKGLSPQKQFELKIDSIVISTFTGKQLEAGVNLSLFPETPQMRQSEKVASLNESRRKIISGIRDIKLVEFNILKPDELFLSTEEKKEILNVRLKNFQNQSNFGYYKMQFTNYIGNAEKQEEKLLEAEGLVNEIYQINQPVLHFYRINQIN